MPRRAARDDGVPHGLLTIGSLETTAALRLAPLLAGYAADYPEVDLVLRTGTTRELIGDVLEQRVRSPLSAVRWLIPHSARKSCSARS